MYMYMYSTHRPATPSVCMYMHTHLGVVEDVAELGVGFHKRPHLFRWGVGWWLVPWIVRTGHYR